MLFSSAICRSKTAICLLQKPLLPSQFRLIAMHCFSVSLLLGQSWHVLNFSDIVASSIR
jgi:hypothetical protein